MGTIPCPLIYYGAFYTTQTFVLSGRFQPLTAMETASTNRLEDIRSLWMFWGPMHFISFNYLKPSTRGPFAAAVGTAWVLILSFMRGNPNKGSGADANKQNQLPANPVATDSSDKNQISVSGKTITVAQMELTPYKLTPTA